MTRVGSVYGEALYGLAKEDGVAEQILTELKVLNASFGEEPGFVRLLSAPNLPKEERCKIIDDSFAGRIQPHLLNFMKILTEKGYMRCFGDCCAAYCALYNEDHGILSVKAITAVSLTAEQIAKLFQDAGIAALAVSGSMKTSERNEQLAKFASGDIKVLCACDLLNEGWDCPQTEVLFMARPTMSKVLYTQQLGRGMRNCEGKDHLMVFDFVDNASQYNAPYSMHRLFKLKDYHAGGTVLGRKGDREAEAELYAKGERPEAVIDYPVDATDYEIVDIFNWQEEAAGMISQMEFIRRVDVQSETIEKYVREGLLIPDLIVPMSEHRTFKYFTEETLVDYAEKYGWKLIDDSNRKELFMEMIEQMDMSYSYKPVLLKAILTHADAAGRVKIADIVAYFRNYYETRRLAGLVVEKANSIYAKGGYADKDAERNILSNPFKRFEDMNMFRHTKTLGVIEVDSTVWKKLTEVEKKWIEGICEEKLEQYYRRITK